MAVLTSEKNKTNIENIILKSLTCLSVPLKHLSGVTILLEIPRASPEYKKKK